MPVSDLLLRSSDRSLEKWPSAADFELQLPQVTRHVRRLRLVWVKLTDPPREGATIRLNADLAERVSGEGFAFVTRDGYPERGGVAGGDFTFEDQRPTLDRLRVRADAAEVCMLLRVWCD